jgi:hypothetical protein
MSDNIYYVNLSLRLELWPFLSFYVDAIKKIEAWHFLDGF